ncbi:MAG: hypothetical protein QM647_11360 [Asticcacaulis sp.]|uniref:hypothetical protein n=1 Tax=Asticcacaulis sp. TaxID=1872648 RepID=UPI0039E6992E
MLKTWKIAVLVLGSVMTAVPALAGVSLMQDKPAAIQYDPKSGFPDHNGAFSAMVIVIPQSQLPEFDKTDGSNRHVTRVARAQVGAKMAVKLVFTGLARDVAGNGDVTYDLKVTGPDGLVYGTSDYSHLVAMHGPLGDTKHVFDNRTKVVLMSFDPQDKPGIYTIKAVARDEVAHLEVPLTTTIELLAPAAPVAPAAAAATTAPETTVPAKKKSRRKARK